MRPLVHAARRRRAGACGAPGSVARGRKPALQLHCGCRGGLVLRHLQLVARGARLLLALDACWGVALAIAWLRAEPGGYARRARPVRQAEYVG